MAKKKIWKARTKTWEAEAKTKRQRERRKVIPNIKNTKKLPGKAELIMFKNQHSIGQTIAPDVTTRLY